MPFDAGRELPRDERQSDPTLRIRNAPSTIRVVASPGFLEVPQRQANPRARGLTHMLDKGLPMAAASAVLASAGEWIDIWKFGWGTAYLDPDLDRKLELLAAYEVRPCLGGTLLEVSWLQGKAKACLDWAAQRGFPLVEVSRGVAPIPLDDKIELIRLAKESFTVITEVGSKDPDLQALPRDWGEEVLSDLSAGAWLVVAEGRESGTVGLYDEAGRVKEDVVSALAAAAGPERILFETPRKDQQAWFINTFGSDANLANIAHDDLLGLEALRLGLRADTVVIPRSSPGL
jgi:phosphosulfolactate synthase